jgi:hypothetical protein
MAVLTVDFTKKKLCCECRDGNRAISGNPRCEACYFVTNEKGVKTKPNFRPVHKSKSWDFGKNKNEKF